MTKNEMIRRTREALARFRALPHEEQWHQMIADGTIDEQGRVLMGRDEPEETPEAGDIQAEPRIEKAP